jgi:hypothetical protein
MNDPKRSDAEPEPWHAADEKPAAKKRSGGAPIGTHSLTGDPANVGIPSSPEAAKGKAERSTPRDMPPGAEEPDPLAEPRANTGDLLGRKP